MAELSPHDANPQGQSDCHVNQDAMIEHLLDICTQDSALSDFVRKQILDRMRSIHPSPTSSSLRAIIRKFAVIPGHPPYPVSIGKESGGPFANPTNPSIEGATLSEGLSCGPCSSMKADEDKPEHVQKLIHVKFGGRTVYQVRPTVSSPLGSKCLESEMLSHNGGKEKTTLVLRLQDQFCSSQDVIPHLLSEFDVFGGRDIDFLYCPIAFGRPYIKGFAIVNFRNSEKAASVEASSTGWLWARIQGFSRNASCFTRLNPHVKEPRFRPSVWLYPGIYEPTCLK